MAGRNTPVNWDEALARAEGDRKLLSEMAALFLQTGPALMAALADAIARQDAGGLERAAHSIKSSVGNFGADTAQEAALVLETIGREGGDWPRAEEAYQGLQQCLGQLWPTLKTVAEGVREDSDR